MRSSRDAAEFQQNNSLTDCLTVCSSASKDSNKLLAAISAGILLFAIAGVVLLTMVYLNVKDINKPMPTSDSAPASGTTTTTAPPAATSCPCEGHSGKSLFFPYGEEHGDWLCTDTLAIFYYVDHTITYKILGANGENSPILIKLVIIYIYIYTHTYTNIRDTGTHTHIYIYMCVCVCVCVCVYVCKVY